MSSIRRIDNLGRIVIPEEVRRSLRISDGDALEMETTPNGALIMKKYTPYTFIQSIYLATNVLQREGISCAFYDRHDLIAGNRIAGFPAIVLERWLNERSSFNYSYQGATIKIYPIITLDELYGFLAVIDATQDDYVRAVIRMLEEELKQYSD